MRYDSKHKFVLDSVPVQSRDKKQIQKMQQQRHNSDSAVLSVLSSEHRHVHTQWGFTNLTVAATDEFLEWFAIKNPHCWYYHLWTQF